MLLNFLKYHGTETQMASNYDVDEKTYRKWIWFYITAMENVMPIVVSSTFFAFVTLKHTNLIHIVFNFQLRLNLIIDFLESTDNKALISVDGKDFRIFEHKPFNRQLWSQKFYGPALRYEVAICIHTGYIVWINGPFHAGIFPDIRIFNLELRNLIPNGENMWPIKATRVTLNIYTTKCN